MFSIRIIPFFYISKRPLVMKIKIKNKIINNKFHLYILINFFLAKNPLFFIIKYIKSLLINIYFPFLIVPCFYINLTFGGITFFVGFNYVHLKPYFNIIFFRQW